MNQDWPSGGIINAREVFRQIPIIGEGPKIDEPVSKVLGKKVSQQDPKLIKLVVKFRKNKPLGSMEPDNFLANPEFIKELKEVFS